MLKDWIMFSDKDPEVGEYILVSSRGCSFAIIKWPNHFEDMRFINMANGKTHEDILELDCWISLKNLEKYTKYEDASTWGIDKYVTVPYNLIHDLYNNLDFFKNNPYSIKALNKEKEEEIKWIINNSIEIVDQLKYANPIE